MPAKFTHESEPVQVGLCPACAGRVNVTIRSVVFPSDGGQLVYRRYLYSCSRCINIWRHTKVPYYRNNSNDMSTDPHYDYADALACFLALREDPLPQYDV